jgi:tetratricopeptide (TPR) repeat protein
VLDAAARRAAAELGEVPAVRATIDATIVKSLRGLGEYSRAVEQAAQAHAAAVATLGPEAEVTLALALEQTRALNSADGRHDAALALLQRAVEAYAQRRGADSFAVLKSRGELAVVLFLAKRYAQARDVFSAILPEHVRLLGAEHPTTLTIRGNLAATLTLSGDPAAAAVVLEELLALRTKVHGAEHPETLTVRGNLASARLRAGQFQAAETAFRDYLELCRKLNDATHPSCAERLAGLGKALREQGRYPEAVAVLTEAWQRKQATEGKQFAPAEQVAAELAELYRRWGKPAEQALWQGRAADKVPAPVVVVQPAAPANATSPR